MEPTVKSPEKKKSKQTPAAPQASPRYDPNPRYLIIVYSFPVPYRGRILHMWNSLGNPVTTCLWPLQYRLHTLLQHTTVTFYDSARQNFLDMGELFNEQREIEFMALRERLVCRVIKGFEDFYSSKAVWRAVEKAERALLKEFVDGVEGARKGEMADQELITSKNTSKIMVVIHRFSDKAE